MAMIANVSIYDYDRVKVCDLYDSQIDAQGSAYDIEFIRNYNGVHTLSFKLPYKYDGKINFRWQYLQSDYLIRLYYNDRAEWFVASKPTKSKDSNGVIGTVMCNGLPILLKTKNIYAEFDDENGIGKISELVPKVLAGSGWQLGYCDIIYEKDGQTQKVRSLKSSGKKGALELINTLCNLFRCRPEYDTENKKVNIYAATNRDQMFEGEIGRNLNAISVKEDSEDVVTRLYVEGEYGDDGYIGIDDVNPTGLSYLLNFDYYRKIGVFKARHETALQNYLSDIQDVNARIRTNGQRINEQSGAINNLIGQCDLVLYYTSSGFVTPAHIYGDPAEEERALIVGDSVVVLNDNGTFRYETITSSVASLIRSGDYGIAKFVTKAAGSIGAQEVQIEAKEKEIANLQRKINATTKEDKIAEYQQEIQNLESQISDIYNTLSTGLYARMHAVMKKSGMIEVLDNYLATHNVLRLEQDEIEATFIVAMGNMLRDGYWQNNNYALGQEQALYDDAVEMSNQLAKPAIEYSIDYIRSAPVFSQSSQSEPDLTQYDDIPIGDIHMNAIMRINDDDLDVHENLFIQRIVIGIDHEENGLIDVSNQDLTINSNDFGSLLSRMSQLADLIDQKNTLYERAKAFTRNGTLYTDRLNGQINVLTTQLLSTVSNWYTDEQGNIMFEAVDGGSAMMLCGAGFMIANEKNEDGSWRFRTFGTGDGFTADEIVAGFISAERIEAGSIATSKLMPDVGNTLIISGNPAITDLEKQLAPEFDPAVSYSKGQMVMHNGKFYVFKQNHPAGAWNENHVVSSDLSTQIELLPDQIISYVGQMGYGKTYIQPTDPALDPDKNVMVGDYWIKEAGNRKTWGDVKNGKWQDIISEKWFDLYRGYSEIYCRNGNNEWVQVYNTDVIADAYTSISQTQFEIKMEAYRANAAEGELRSTITQTAESITSEVTRATNAEGLLSSRITQTAESITSEVTRATEAEGALGSRISQSADEITTFVGNTYTRTFVSETDPALVASNHVKTGDYWIKKMIPKRTWREIKSGTWNAAKDATWGNYFNGSTLMYSRNSSNQWVPVIDSTTMDIAYTNIYQNRDMIQTEAYRANQAEGVLSSRITQTAESITSEVSRATNAEGSLSSRITQTAEDITMGVIAAGAVETQGSYIKIRSDSITLNTGGKLIATASQIQIGSGETLESVLATKGDVSESVQEYYLSTSRTSVTGGSWSTTSPTWTEGKYMWMRTKVTHADGTVTYMPDESGTCIAGATGAKGQKGDKGDTGDTGPKGQKGDTGPGGRGIQTIETRYYLHTSYTVEPTAGWSSWKTTMPAYEAGMYYWTWTKTTFSDGSVTDLKLSEFGVNAAYDQAADAAQLASDIITGANGTKAFYSKEILNTGVVIDDTSLHLNSTGNMYVNSGGALVLRSTASTEQNPQNVVVMNNTGIAVMTSGTLSINSGANLAINSQGTMTIASGGAMSISSGGSLTINSGGTFSLTSTYFNVATDGKILCSGGKIAGWIISGTQFLSENNDASVTNAGMGLEGHRTDGATTAIWVGSPTPNATTPFRVTYDGTVYATNGVFTGTVTTGANSVIGSTYITTDAKAPVTILQQTVQNNISHGQGAKDYLDDVNSGSKTFTRLGCDSLFVKHTSSGGIWQAGWKKTGVKAADGSTVYLNYIGSSTSTS